MNDSTTKLQLLGTTPQQGGAAAQGCILVIASTYVLVNTLTDLLYRFLDPRIKVE